VPNENFKKSAKPRAEGKSEKISQANCILMPNENLKRSAKPFVSLCQMKI
jgi:hypothetical protein